jgi:hypothetical protein
MIAPCHSASAPEEEWGIGEREPTAEVGAAA